MAEEAPEHKDSGMFGLFGKKKEAERKQSNPVVQAMVIVEGGSVHMRDLSNTNTWEGFNRRTPPDLREIKKEGGKEKENLPGQEEGKKKVEGGKKKENLPGQEEGKKKVEGGKKKENPPGQEEGKKKVEGGKKKENLPGQEEGKKKVNM